MQEKCLSQACQDVHERVKVIEVENKARDIRDVEIKKAIQELTKVTGELKNVIQDLKEVVAKHDVKIKVNCDEVKTIKANQWKIAITALTGAIAALWHTIIKHL